MGREERTLVERARTGDSQAFGQIYQQYVDRTYSFIAFRVRDKAAAEDLTQEVFLQAFRALGDYDWRGSLAPWLLRIARNLVIDHWRRQGRRPEHTMTAYEVDRGDDEGQIDRIVDESSRAAQEAAETVLDRARIVRAARCLTALQQQVVALRFSAGLSIRETAEVMGKSEGAIKNLQHHALKALKKQLGEDDD